MRSCIRTAIVAVATAAVALPIGIAIAKGPEVTVSAKKHPNLNAAQKLAADAYEKLKAAQKANEYDMDGHAKKAEEMLKTVNDEIKLAAEAANKAK